MNKFASFILSIFLQISIHAQSYQKSYFPKDNEIKLSEIISLHNAPTLGTTTNSPIIVQNYFAEQIFKESGILIHNIDNQSTISTALKIYNPGRRISCLSSVLDNDLLYMLIQSDALDIGLPYLVLMCYKTTTKKIIWNKRLSGPINAIQSTLLLSNNKLHILANVNDKGLYIQSDLSGIIINAKYYISNDPDKIIDWSTATISAQSNIIIAGTMDQPTELNKDILLMSISQNGDLNNAKLLNFFNADRSYQFRAGRLFLDKNADNIHLAHQAVVGRSDAGPISLTMFDEGLNLKTWRNYSPEMRLEDFNISNVNFMLSGQRPVANGKIGYALARINALNAIPEKLSSLEWDRFHNYSIASSSAILFNSNNRTIVLAAKPNNDIENIISIATVSYQNTSSCEGAFTFTVTKDPIDVNPTSDINIESTKITSEPEALIADNTPMTLHSECISTSSEHDVQSNYKVYYHHGNILIKSDNIAIQKINIYDLQGKLCLSKSINDISIIQKLDCHALTPSIYLIEIMSKQGKAFHKLLIH